MRSVGRWALRIVAALALLALLALGAVYLASERVLSRTHAAEERRVSIPTDVASIVEGRRLAALRGCYGGCHGDGTAGEVFFDPPGLEGLLFGRFVTPDLGRLARSWSVAELEAAIRQGVRPDGTSTLAMPSSMLQHLSDEDLGRILAFLRSRGEGEGWETDVRLGPLARFFVLRGVFEPQAELVGRARTPPAATPRADTMARGEYLARTVCTECHGLDFEGAGELGTAPPLAVVAGYGPDEFARLMATGEAVGGRELGLMRDVSLSRFSHFTEDEVAALYAYLRERAGT